MKVVIVSKCKMSAQSVLFSVSCCGLIHVFRTDILRTFYNSGTRRDGCAGQTSHITAISCLNYASVSSIDLYTSDLIAQFGLLRYRGTSAGRRVQFRARQHQFVTSSVRRIYQQQRLPTIVAVLSRY